MVNLKVNFLILNLIQLSSCLYAGIPLISSYSSDQASVWQYEIGPCNGLLISDYVMMSRFILQLIGEQFNCVISFDSEYLPGIKLNHNLGIKFCIDKLKSKNDLAKIR